MFQKLVLVTGLLYNANWIVSACTDTDSRCSSWVSNGFCSNSFYTAAQKQQYCARSCNLCTSTGGGGGSGGTGGSGGSGSCVDSDSRCSTWVTNGFCQNSFYTTAQKQQYCARSCNLCSGGGGGGGSCADADNRCATWKTNGFCTSSFYTQPQKCQYCASSCNLCSVCGGSGTPAPPGAVTTGSPGGETPAGGETGAPTPAGGETGPTETPAP